ncbi:MAG TPA: SGNH/GDSL hydrolase family protein [Noviherbaspirillum sp.]|uniref:SGNH/GDSL hydrolase family protein n=1 Tax=Noviherbaspirillum sp. TaxID=1926288 RepID=UPI002B4A935E|nr:SGNH/GDSL hydrolase family protein [Noviherbaspirillum sp.]HJV86696.1 SGNH/GDSL hydrolase family protein [Noviherbaspirillum sp.]
MRRFVPELVALPLLPFLIVQGRRTRRVTPRLPEAGGPNEGIAGTSHAGRPLSLLAVGESPVAGVGVRNHEQAITGQFASALAERLQRPVAWRACGKNGVTVREAFKQIFPHIPAAPVDIALIAFGVNDTTAFRPASAWRRELGILLDALQERCSPTCMIVSGVPPMAHLPALPQPLRWVMGLKAQVLDAEVRMLVPAFAHTLYVPLLLDTHDRSLVAPDGYHPSESGCRAWAALLADACTGLLAAVPASTA